ncbi:MAG: pSer/pThr/pTyr-binding forkhead associated (FHA) protein [Myxococcota bacterium]|jgi:pSer/pThr/pTyr-binding forkhead associated (FHA) protein
MGVLKHQHTDTNHHLVASTLIGRGTNADLRLERRACSGTHARLSWRQGLWSVSDLGSRNGTWLNDQQLTAGTSHTLRAGDHLAFGDRQDIWTLASATEPVALARCREKVCVAEDGVVALPDGEDVQALVYPEGIGQWAVEDEAGARVVVDREVVVVAGEPWTLFLPEPEVMTQDAAGNKEALSAFQARFEASQDEEFIQLSLVQPTGRVVSLESRVHHYTLLILARARMADPTGGWEYTDEIMRMLRLSRQRFNMHVYRARQQLDQAGLKGEGIIERRVGSAQVRFGLSDIVIVPV